MRQFLLALSVFVCTIVPANSQIVYVDLQANGDNDGSSWRDAYTTLQNALAEAPEEANLWISRGTYTTTARDESFTITKSLKLYGGFRGDESSFNQRRVDSYLTDISGDVNDDDDYDSFPNNKDENSIHVITINEGLLEVVIDGVTIRGGDTDHSIVVEEFENQGNGGGILNLGSSLTLRDCIISNNFADSRGGGIFIDPTPDIDLNIIRCEFNDNGTNSRGGALGVLTPGAKVNIEGSSFDNNFALHGASINHRGLGAVLEINDSKFIDGLATGVGGAIVVGLSSEVIIMNSEFEKNRGYGGGGGIVIDDVETTQLKNCVFKDNKANVSNGRGGAISLATRDGDIHTDGTVLIDNCLIENNEADLVGGGIYSEGTIVEIINTEIRNNIAEVAGGGFIAILGADVKMKDVEISNNTSNEGAGIYLQDNAEYLFEDCTVTSNESTESGGGLHIDILASGQVPIVNCVFDKNISASSGGAIYLSEGVINISDTQFTSNEAEYGGAISNNYLGSEVNLINSTFTKNRASNTGGALEGFDNSKYLIDDCVFTENESPLGGAIGCDAISSIKVTNSEFDKNLSTNLGGAIEVFGTGELIVEGSKFSSNEAIFGGAISADDIGTSVSISDCEFLRNEAQVEGGGLAITFGAELNMSNSQFVQNDVRGVGGAVSIGSDSIPNNQHSINACIFDDNRALTNSDFDSGYGSAIVLYNANVELQNSLFINNSASSGGVIQPNDYDNQENILSITNCTFARNMANDDGVILAWNDLAGDESNIVLQNNIFTDDNLVIANDQGEANVNSNGGNLSVNDSMADIFNHAKDQNEVDPRFKDDRDDFRLSSTSPAINAGVNSGAPETDLVGFERDQAVDIGAYESQEVTSVFTKAIPAGEISLLPNPARDILYYSLESDWSGDFNIEIFNVMGQRMFAVKDNKHNRIKQQSISVTDLMPGTYMFRISRGNQESTMRFVKI